VQVIDQHPDLLGIGLDEPAAIVVKGDEFEVIGSGKVAIYDGLQHEKAWYCLLAPGDQFDLVRRKPVSKR
jgi:cyanophycinase